LQQFWQVIIGEHFCPSGRQVLSRDLLGLQFRLLPFDDAWSEDRSEEKNERVDRNLHDSLSVVR
jgi:hypothetical protein